MAVYTDVSDDDLAHFLGQYDVGELRSFKGIAEGVENSNYFLQTSDGSFILTLYEKRVERADLPFYLGLLNHVAAKGLPSATAVLGRDGQALRTLAGRPAALIQFLDGVSVRRPDPIHCAEVGGALAKLHLAAADFPIKRRNALSLDGWKKLVADIGANGESVMPGMTAFIGDELAHLSAHWPKALPRGIIHADLFPDNVFFLDNKVSGLIDFYFACEDFLSYDIAVCLNAWCFETDGSFNVTKARALLARYASVRAPGADEIAALPVLARGSALRFLLTRLYDWINHDAQALVRPKDPMEYVEKLRFHQGVTHPRAYGLDA